MQGAEMERFFLLVLINVVCVCSQKLPDYIKICHLSDADLNGCIKSSIEDLRPKLVTGMPELNVPPIEPMEIEELVANQGSSLKIIIRKIKLFGASNFTIVSLNVDMKSKLLTFDVSFVDLHIEGLYDVDGRVITIPVRGKGNMVTDARDIKAAITMQGDLETRGGVEYLKFTGMTMDLVVGKGKVALENLFGGDKLIGEVVNAAINTNFQFFMKELNPILVETLKDFILKSANKLVESVPYNVAFPE